MALVQIKNVDPQIAHKFKIEAVTEGLTHAQLFHAMWQHYLLSKKLNAKKEEREKREEKE